MAPIMPTHKTETLNNGSAHKMAESKTLRRKICAPATTIIAVKIATSNASSNVAVARCNRARMVVSRSAMNHLPGSPAW